MDKKKRTRPTNAEKLGANRIDRVAADKEGNINAISMLNSFLLKRKENEMESRDEEWRYMKEKELEENIFGKNQRILRLPESKEDRKYRDTITRSKTSKARDKTSEKT